MGYHSEFLKETDDVLVRAIILAVRQVDTGFTAGMTISYSKNPYLSLLIAWFVL